MTIEAVENADTDLRDLLAAESSCVRRSLAVLGEILSGATEVQETDERFAQRWLGMPHTDLAAETMSPATVLAMSIRAALADVIELHTPAIGPGDGTETPAWSRVDIDGRTLSLPKTLSAFFPAGSLADADVVVRLRDRSCYGGASLTAYTRPEHRDAARRVVDAIVSAARTDKNVLRGRCLRARSDEGLVLEIADLASDGRASLVVPQDVWDEIDANVASVTSRAELMRSLGLGTRRGVLLAGPPGVGKSAISAAVAAELLGAFTVVIVEARAAQWLLHAVYEETKELGPTVIILEDVDLYVGNRANGSGGSSLADFLSVLDGSAKYDDVLTIASTNDPDALDKAATRAARFDAVIHLDYPNREARATILRGLLARIDGCAVDCAAVAARLPGDVSGADLREVVRRAVLQHGTELTTAAVLEVVAQGRWKPEPLTGNYL